MLKYGMYAKCEIINHSGEYKEVVVQLDSTSGKNTTGFCYEWNSAGKLVIRHFRIGDSAIHVRLRVNTEVLIKGSMARIIEWSDSVTEDGHYKYWCRHNGRIILVSEKDMQAPYDAYDISPENLFDKNNISAINDYLSRHDIEDFMNKVQFITEGYNDALNHKIDMYEHQIDTVQQVITTRPYRAILADEVGLGKTVEALVLLTYAMNKKICKSALIVVPDQIVFQWYSEAKTKFNLEVMIFSPNKFIYKKEYAPIVLISFSQYIRYYEEYLKYKEWDFVLVDEVHRSLKNKKLYNCLYSQCKKTKNFIMLSATPIMKRNAEYFDLLKLLKPGVYGKVDLLYFTEVMKKKELIEQDVLGIISDMKFSFEEDDLGQYEDRVLSIAEKIHDYKIIEYLKSFDNKSSEEIKSGIRFIVGYLQNVYELESRFIRHRRSDILDPSAKRILYKHKGFYLHGEDKLSYELNVYEMLSKELEGTDEEKIDIELKIRLVNAFFSSISALQKELVKNNLLEILPGTSKAVYVQTQKEQASFTNSRIQALFEVINNIDSSEKVVIFTEFYESAQLVYKFLVKRFGKETVGIFSAEGSEAKMQIAANTFKNQKKIRFLVCDNNGAEGQNFQFADYIVHFDIPWSPARMEQRIGRLDRIGRKSGRLVKNLVLYVNDTIEEDLFCLYNQCLNIYEESLSGIEIIFDELWDVIKETVSKKGLLGFTSVFDTIQDLKNKCGQILEDEMINAYMQDNDLTTLNAKSTIEQFSEHERNRFLRAVCNWHYLSGYDKPYETREGVFNVDSIVRDEIILKERKYKPHIKVSKVITFDSELALNDEFAELVTLADPFLFDVIEHVGKTDFGKVAAVYSDNVDWKWHGLVITWKADFREIDYMRKNWSSLYSGIKNDFIRKSRLSVSYAVNSQELLADEILEFVRESATSLHNMSMDEIEEELGSVGIDKLLKDAIEDTQKIFYEYMQKEFDYENIRKKINQLKQNGDINSFIGRSNESSRRMIEIFEAIYLMFKNMRMKIESILYVSCDGSKN